MQTKMTDWQERKGMVIRRWTISVIMKAIAIDQCLIASMSGLLDLTGKCSHYNKALLQGCGDEIGKDVSNIIILIQQKKKKKIVYKFFSYAQSWSKLLFEKDFVPECMLICITFKHKTFFFFSLLIQLLFKRIKI